MTMTHATDYLGHTKILLGVMAILVIAGSLFAPTAVAQSDTSEFDIEITDAPDEASVGEKITISVNVTNSGEITDNTTVALVVNGTKVDTETTDALAPNSTEPVRLTNNVKSNAPDEANFVVSTDDDDDDENGTFTVVRDPQFKINIVNGPSESVSAGETIELTTEVENINNTGGPGETTVTLRRDGDPIRSKSTELESGELEKVNFSYETTERDLGGVDLRVEVEDDRASRSVTVGPPDGEKFAAGRTAERFITVALAESAVGPNGSIKSNTETIKIASDPEHDIVWEWDVAADPQNGIYQKRLTVPQAGHIDDVSLVNASVKIENTDFSDRVDLHTVESATFGAWAGRDTLYLPVETVGVTDASATDVSVRLSDGTVDASFEDPHTVAVDFEKFRDQTNPADPTVTRFETNRSPVGSATGIEPEIRYLHGEIVLWHPHIETGEHMVTIHGVDGEGNETSANLTADRPGVIPLPNGDQLAGANSVNISVSDVIDTQEVGGPGARTQSLNATLLDGGTIQTDRNLESLAISAVLVDTRSDTVYITGDKVSVNSNKLQISGVSLDAANDVQTMELATNAGIVEVELSSAGGMSSAAGSSILWLVMRLVLISLGAIVIIGGGILTGSRFGFNDRLERGIFAVVITFALAIVLFDRLEMFFFESLSLPFQPWGSIGVGAVAIFGVGYAIGAQRGTNESSQKSHTQPPLTRIGVRVTDGTDPIKEEVKIQATSGYNSGRKQSIRGGSGELKLPEEDKRWRVTATLATENRTYTSDPVPVNPRTIPSQVTLEIEQPTVSVRVQDSKHEFPIPDALVRMETAGEVETKRADEEGNVRFDPPPQAETVTLTADHDKYEQATVKRQLPESGFGESIELRQLPGQLRVQSQIDGVATGGMDVEIVPEEPTLKELYKDGLRIEATTDESGESTKDGLLVGRYRVGLALPDRFEHLFETTEEQVRVDQPGETVTLEASFTWNLSTPQRDRIARIRGKLRDITTKSGVDIAIPEYYVSVVETILEAVESFPEWGHHFAEIDADPDTVTDATLDSAAEATETIAEAMSTKRNLDLFTACSDMPDTNVQWTGSFDMGLLVDRLGEGPMVARRAFAARADEVSSRIESDRGSLSEIAPARELLDRIDIDESGEEVKDVVSIHVGILLLDAIAELFDHQELRERLSRTVF